MMKFFAAALAATLLIGGYARASGPAPSPDGSREIIAHGCGGWGWGHGRGGRGGGRYYDGGWCRR